MLDDTRLLISKRVTRLITAELGLPTGSGNQTRLANMVTIKLVSLVIIIIQQPNLNLTFNHLSIIN